MQAEAPARLRRHERMGTMNFGEGIRVALFCMGMVFALLAAIYALVKLTSAIISRSFSGRRTKN
jgi:Na+-transporting methylmalonyl-CoA/oxaloacetate decarboxylase gamma subunit